MGILLTWCWFLQFFTIVRCAMEMWAQLACSIAW